MYSLSSANPIPDTPTLLPHPNWLRVMRHKSGPMHPVMAEPFCSTRVVLSSERMLAIFPILRSCLSHLEGWLVPACCQNRAQPGGPMSLMNLPPLGRGVEESRGVARLAPKPTPETSLRPISHCPYPLLAGAVCTAIHRPIRLHAMAQDSAATMTTGGSKRLDRTLKAIKRMRLVPHDHFKCFVIVIPACFAVCHVDDSSNTCYPLPQHNVFTVLLCAKASAPCKKRKHKLCQATLRESRLRPSMEPREEGCV